MLVVGVDVLNTFLLGWRMWRFLEPVIPPRYKFEHLKIGCIF